MSFCTDVNLIASQKGQATVYSHGNEAVIKLKELFKLHYTVTVIWRIHT